MITLYSTGCPKCQVLEKRLKKNKLDFIVSDDINILIDKGYQSAPVLAIGELFYDYGAAMDLLKKYEQGKKELIGGSN